MNNDIIKAKEILIKENATCVFCNNNDIIISQKRGVRPLIDCIESGRDFSEYSVADKVIGNGAAYLYVLLNVKEIYASVISKAACKTLMHYGIEYSYNTIVPSIQNRAGTGICPMEKAVAAAVSPQHALDLIKNEL